MDPIKDRLGHMLRTARSFLPRKGTAEEKVNFVHFSYSESEKELSTLQNCGIQRASWSNGSLDARSVVDEMPNCNSNPKDQLSEWQAGWNVTNAIQVTIFRVWGFFLNSSTFQ